MNNVKRPLISIVTVALNDAWSIVKTARSVFSQTFKDFEYVVIDGNSNDGSSNFIDFLIQSRLANNSLVEPDNGVYDAMNKAFTKTTGEFICFMNAGDVFPEQTTLERIAKFIKNNNIDGCMGWGSLNGQIWASWSKSDAYKIASLGFCHQSLYLRRELIESFPFDSRTHKTDSDTLQLSRIYSSGANVAIIPEVLAIRGGEAGISANLDRTKNSIIDTLTNEYKELSLKDAELLLSFRRSCSGSKDVLNILNKSVGLTRNHIAKLILDTLFTRQSRNLEQHEVDQLLYASLSSFKSEENLTLDSDFDRLLACQSLKAEILKKAEAEQRSQKNQIEKFTLEDDSRVNNLQEKGLFKTQIKCQDVIVALTSFPARISCVHLVIRSILYQTHRPKEIHLFLGRDEFPSYKSLPSALLAYQSKGLIIHFVKKTYHQYDKFIHGSDLNKLHDYIIIDDDVIYPPNSIEALLNGRECFPGHVIGNRCHLIPAQALGEIPRYEDWIRETHLDNPSFRLVPTGAGGVLYPKGFMNEPFVCDPSEILATAPYADDLWLKSCAIAQGISTYATPLSFGAKWYHRYTPTMRAGTLMDVNIGLGLNDLQMSKCSAWLDKKRTGWRKDLQDLVEVN